MCEYCEPSMSFGNGGVSVGTRAIIDGDGDIEPKVYVNDCYACIEYECVIDTEPINYCPMFVPRMRGTLRAHGHVKTMWCPFCKAITDHIERGIS